MVRLTKHEKFVVPMIAETLIDIWSAVQDRVPTETRIAIDDKIVQLRRCLTPDHPNARPAKPPTP